MEAGLREENLLQAPFIRNEEKQHDRRLFEKGMGVDIYVDGARFLPDNTSVSKVQVSIYNRERESLMRGESGVAVLGSADLSPRYDLKVTLRLPQLDPSLLLLVTLLTIDSSDNQVKVLGYSAINLFLDRNTL